MKKTQLIIIILGIFFFQSCQQAGDGISPSGNGMGGSLARFTLGDGMLYIVSNFDLNVFDINAFYYWTYRSFPWSAFLKISLSTPINILKDQILALMIESPCLKYEIANREGLFL